MFCIITISALLLIFFFFNDTATTEIYTLSLHDALPISTGTVPGLSSPDRLRRPHRVLVPRPERRLLGRMPGRSEEHTSELQSQSNLVCRLLLEKKKNINIPRCLMYSPYTDTTHPSYCS